MGTVMFSFFLLVRNLHRDITVLYKMCVAVDVNFFAFVPTFSPPNQTFTAQAAQMTTVWIKSMAWKERKSIPVCKYVFLRKSDKERIHMPWMRFFCALKTESFTWERLTQIKKQLEDSHCTHCAFSPNVCWEECIYGVES